jgi:hypothetical protein
VIDMSSAIDDLARDYLHEVIRGQADEREAFDRFVSLMERDTEAAWKVVCRLAEAQLTDYEVAILGSVAIEDILTRYPGVFIKRAAEEAIRNPRFKIALNYVTIEPGEVPLDLIRQLDDIRES